jgi:hypothetical protein
VSALAFAVAKKTAATAMGLRKRGVSWRTILGVGAGVAAVGLLFVLFTSPAQASTRRSGYCKARKLTPEIINLARKWATTRGLPVKWVIATILAESGGNPTCVGDYHVLPEGASIGLMQVNTKAHGPALAAAGVTRTMLFEPDINIEWGTRILRGAYDTVRKALEKRPSKIPVEKLLRLQYRGVPAGSDVVQGRDPGLRLDRQGIPYLASYPAWDANLVRASALV